MKNNFIEINGEKFSTLVAITPEDHSRGLMWQPWPPPIMVFPYKKAQIRKFWMRNTVSPLDILFCRNGKIISICFGEPYSTQLIGPEDPSDLVIELPRGQAKNFCVGNSVKIYLSDSVAHSLIRCSSGLPAAYIS